MTLKLYPLPNIPVIVQCIGKQWHDHDLHQWLLDNIDHHNYIISDQFNDYPNKTIYFTKQEDAVWFALTWT